MQTLKQCTWILSQSHKDDESMMEMSGRALAAHNVAMSMQMAKRVSLNWPWGLNRSPHKIEPLYPFTGHNTG